MSLLLFFFCVIGSLASSVKAAPLINVTYGSDPSQIMDLYVPQDTEVTKIFVLVHGGAWGAGYKEEMDQFIPHLQTDFPTYAIANINYRLGTQESPGFPKQLQDIDLALTFLRQAFTTDITFALYGGSAGAHLSMLYAYSWPTANAALVKLVVDVVGPTDLNDPSYSANPAYADLFFALVGPCVYLECPELYNETSPIIYTNSESQPTIGFYGNFDLLVPNSQMVLMEDRLSELGVSHQFVRYTGGHEWNWSEADRLHMRISITEFVNLHW